MRIVDQQQLIDVAEEILRQLDSGTHFSVAVDGRRVAVLGPPPHGPGPWIRKDVLLKLLQAHTADPGFRDDVAGLGGTVHQMEDPFPQ